MRTSNKAQQIIFAAILVVSLGCNKKEDGECVFGVVIGLEKTCTTNSLLIEVKNHASIGKEITYYDSTVYSNVVRVPAQEPIGSGEIYFTYRPYNKEDDYDLFHSMDHPCNALMGPYDVPTLVILEHSTTNCPVK